MEPGVSKDQTSSAEHTVANNQTRIKSKMFQSSSFTATAMSGSAEELLMDMFRGKLDLDHLLPF